MAKATAPSDDTQSQSTEQAAPKSLAEKAREEFGSAFHGDVEEPPRPEPREEPAEVPDIPDIPDEDLDEGQENKRLEGDDVDAAPKPEAAEDDSEPIATVRELVEHLEADPSWFDQLKVDVKVHDKASQVPLREIIDNYERDQAAGERLEWAKAKSTQAQQEIAERNAALDLEFEKAAKLASMNEQQLMAEVAAVNWDQLQREDPALWSAKRVELKERFDRIQHAKQQTAYEFQHARAKQAEDDNQRRYSIEQEQSQLLMKAMPAVSPEWGDPQKGPEVKGRLMTYLVGKYGFGPQEIAAQLDHRAFVIAEKARLWDESQGKVQLTKKRIQSVPRVMKPGARKEPSAVNLEKVREAQKKLRSTGHMDDALALLRAKQVRR